MITIIRSAAIAPGKIGDAVAFAHNIAKFLQEKYSVKLTIVMPIGGNPNRIAWLATYASMADWEELVAKMMADPEYGAMIAANSATFNAGSVYDEIWRSI